LEFRAEFAQKLSITRLDYMIRMLRVNGKGRYSISDPDAFKEKIKFMERREKRRMRQQDDDSGIRTAKSTSSFGSKFDQS